MRLAVTAFTRRGIALARKLAGALCAEGERCTVELPQRLAGEAEGYVSLSQWAGERFADTDGLIFVGACGIAVRAVAPFIRDKFSDPAVVSIDEGGAFAVPLLSGHVGGANHLARRIATITGGQAVVSTATDVNGLFAVDQWAAEQGFAILDREAARHISAALLEGNPVGFSSVFPVEGALPNGVAEGPAELGFAVTPDSSITPFRETLRLIPRCLRLGIGCRRGSSADTISRAADRVLAGAGLPWAAVEAVCTIDRKADELGLLAFCSARKLPLLTYRAEELQAVPGVFTPSTFVLETVGVDNVCERAAVADGGTLIVRKMAGDGVTVAVAQKMVTVRFDGWTEKKPGGGI